MVFREISQNVQPLNVRGAKSTALHRHPVKDVLQFSSKCGAVERQTGDFARKLGEKTPILHDFVAMWRKKATCETVISKI